MKLIKVGTFPGRISEVAVEDNATVAEALEVADLNSEGYEIQLDGRVVGLDEPIRDCSLLVLAKQVKGA